MDFRLKKKGSAGKALHRINLELRARIIGLFHDESLDADSAVREIRACIDRLGSVLRVARPAMKEKTFRRSDRALEDFAGKVEGLYECGDMVDTFDCLTDHYRPFLDTAELQPVRQALQSRHAQAIDEYQERLDRQELQAAFVQVELVLDRAGWPKVPSGLLAAAVHDAYRHAQAMYHALEQDPDTDNSHGLWRAACYLRHQLRLLEKRLSPEAVATVRALDELDERLAEDNAMAVLAANLRQRNGLCCNRVQAELLDSLAESRRIALLSGILRQAAGLFDAKPARFTAVLFPHS